jgi:hypothetical protein
VIPVGKLPAIVLLSGVLVVGAILAMAPGAAMAQDHDSNGNGIGAVIGGVPQLPQIGDGRGVGQ